MSTVFHFTPGETEKRLKAQFGFRSWFGRLGSANLCTNRPSDVQRVCQISPRRRLESEQEDTGFARNLELSCCRVRCPQRRKRSAGDSGRYSSSSACILRGGPKISRKM